MRPRGRDYRNEWSLGARQRFFIGNSSEVLDLLLISLFLQTPFLSLFSQNLAAAREVRGLEQVAAELQARMQKKATLVARDAFNLSLSSVQTLQQQHRCLEVRVHPQGLPT